MPVAQADPPRGALVNVVGTVNVLEAARRGEVAGVAYAPSAAAYDRGDGVRVEEDADGHPLYHYGVHKQANEGAARVYFHDAGLSSVGLRPHVVYGPGRDHGMTAGPTLAMAAGVAGEPYEIPFGGREQYPIRPGRRRQVHRRRASLRRGPGAHVRNLGGPSEHVTDVIAGHRGGASRGGRDDHLQGGRGAPAAGGHGGRRPRHHSPARRRCRDHRVLRQGR